jgi:hypothetical protein
MQTLTNEVVGIGIQIIVLLVLGGLSVVVPKTVSFINNLKKKDTLGIIDVITNRAVQYADQELKGAKGIEKRDFALQHATKILGDYGIKVSQEQLLAEIQDGYNKFRKDAPKKLVFSSAPIEANVVPLNNVEK